MNYSVLMSIYKKEKAEYFRTSLDSMLNQTVQPSEIVIVKDGELTNTLENVISEYTNNYPNLFHIVPIQHNIGLGLALNEGLKVCKNELVARMDTDDISLPYRCELQLKKFSENENLDIVGTAIDEFNDDPTKPYSKRVVPIEHEAIYQFAKRRSPFNHPTVMYKKSKVLACNGYCNLPRNQDVDLFGRMLYSGCKAVNLGESLLLFRSNEGLLKRRKNWINTKTYIQTINNFRKIGFSSFGDFLIVAIAQIGIFCCPVSVQHWLYKNFLRK